MRLAAAIAVAWAVLAALFCLAFLAGVSAGTRFLRRRLRPRK